MQETANQST
jgi:hypothetical protein